MSAIPLLQLKPFGFEAKKCKKSQIKNLLAITETRVLNLLPKLMGKTISKPMLKPKLAEMHQKFRLASSQIDFKTIDDQPQFHLFTYRLLSEITNFANSSISILQGSQFSLFVFTKSHCQSTYTFRPHAKAYDSERPRTDTK